MPKTINNNVRFDKEMLIAINDVNNNRNMSRAFDNISNFMEDLNAEN